MTRLHTNQLVEGMTYKQIQSITVIGAGQMGHQIAMLAAFGGYGTILQDAQENALNIALGKLDH
ncbi:3-hydroxyacyl-CoA dehydrogenase NAD-binding domain-containing protein [Peribacillus simplex]|uniref:3-hydroxyacyl-CoA dehydrogenase NAD-binding domain-containing protein n=1 Tax=Peribacillus simplex TaxID=1478 RepID=A0AAW7ISR7_9BACI|nr:3-hydroxyacyl-CoA dehydrogenase NAD-binding domain-containing protein [Peribacillus simplex]MDM5454682.1 3-hydroxyacyl-CoA dehydrogenase NAD-binding domain-containing protein [Peribacillus simplex]